MYLYMMKYLSSFFIFFNIILVYANAQINFVTGDHVQPRDNEFDNLLTDLMSPESVKQNSVPESPVQNAAIYKISRGYRRHGFGRYGPFTNYKPNFLPISYYGKRNDDVLQTIKSKYYLKNSENNKVEYEKRSVASAVVRSDPNEYETLLKTISMLQSGKDSDLLNIINNYEGGFKHVLELLVPPLSADKLENIKSLLNSMIKRRFGSWGGRKRSEFYSWGGRKKRDQINVDPRAEENRLTYLEELKETDNDSLDKYAEPNMYGDGISTQLTTDKRNNDFYPWGGKRTLPPPLPQY